MSDTVDKINFFLNQIAFAKVDNEEELNYQDPFVTSEQKKRDAQITELLVKYVESYKKKIHHSTICRYIILIPCISIVVIFAVVLIIFSCQIVGSQDSIDTGQLIAFITSCVSFISLIVGMLTIITKYFFPENDEQYITTIVESIQRNDLENKRENAKYKQNENISH